MDPTFDECVVKIEQAKLPEDLFGDCDLNEMKTTYTYLMKVVHPDRHFGADRATHAAARLTQLYLSAQDRMRRGIYGSRPVLMQFKTRRHNYIIHERTGIMGIADIFTGMMDDTEPVIFHVASQPTETIGSLIKHEAKALIKLHEPKDDGAVSWQSMLPKLIECIDIPVNGKPHKCNVYKDTLQGFVSLAEVERKFGSAGIDGKDVAWMLRRALDVLGYAHSIGVIHGGLNPTNIFVGPGDIHQVVIANWQNAILDPDDRVRSVEKDYRFCVAPEILKKQPASPASDLFSLGQSFLRVCGSNTSKRVSLFLQSFILASPVQRPQNAFEIRKEFTRMIRELWGEAKYHPFIFN